jgi:molybdopterin-guanine dinucleotide biosynthesis protein A
MQNKVQITGYLLSGGKSSRMGNDKALKLLHGKTMIEHVITQLETEVDSVVIVSDHPNHASFGKPVINDLIKNIGPAGGIYSALSHSITEKNFIVSCDMPYITSEGIRFLINHSQDFEITFPKLEYPQPLFGVYSKKCLPLWEKLIQSGQLSLRQLILHFKLNLLPVNDSNIYSEKFFSNINSPSELDAFNNEIETGLV